jgi:colanic acid biosynthesis protein WcaH
VDKKKLNFSDFKNVVRNTPLISIDLIIENSAKKVLLGKRTNRPARDFWFVPGGRIFKDETLEDAFNRIVKAEIGVEQSITDAKFVGVYQHFYNDNFSEDDFSTHYIVLAYKLFIDDDDERTFPLEQHSDYKWLETDLAKKDPLVHKFTKVYFI